jgi:hypothetical protein
MLAGMSSFDWLFFALIRGPLPLTLLCSIIGGLVSALRWRSPSGILAILFGLLGAIALMRIVSSIPLSC